MMTETNKPFKYESMGAYLKSIGLSPSWDNVFSVFTPEINYIYLINMSFNDAVWFESVDIYTAYTYLLDTKNPLISYIGNTLSITPTSNEITTRIMNHLIKYALSLDNFIWLMEDKHNEKTI